MNSWSKIAAAQLVWTKLFLAILVVASALPAVGALIVRDGGMVYESASNRTWLQDANYANTHGYDFSGGAMDWATAKSWVTNINVGGFTDWRLPTQIEFRPWFGNELCDYSDPNNPQLHPGPFTNIQFSADSMFNYWTNDRTVVNNNPFYAYSFSPFYNVMGAYPIDPSLGFDFYVWPVRTGDVISQVGLPTLQILRSTTNSAVLSWPTNSVGFILEKSTSLITTNWTSVTNGIMVSGTNNQAIISLASSNAFFRLSHP